MIAEDAVTKSLMYMQNVKGQSMDTCGTPQVTLAMSDVH